MALSQDDLKRHNEILSHLSATLSTVMTDLEMFVPKVYLKNRNIWTEVLKLNLNRAKELAKSFERESVEKQGAFEEHGLTGTELEFKHNLINTAYTQFSQTRGNERTRKRLLSKLLSLLDDYLDSLERIIPSVGVLKEFKSFMEHLISHSEPRCYSNSNQYPMRERREDTKERFH